VSNPESFIDEVTEEVRRDRLFALMRRYGWIAILAVVVLVGGAAVNEWRKASARAQAETFGDAILTAMSHDDAAARTTALQGVAAEGDSAAIVALLEAGEADGDTARAALEKVAADTTAPTLYRDLAVLKLTMMTDAGTAEDRIATLEPLTAAGAPFRVLAEEQIAIAEVEAGQAEAAISRLQQLLADDEASQALRRRASQLIVALGGTPEGA